MHYLLYFLFFVFIALLSSETCIASLNSDLPVSSAQTANHKHMHETHSIRNKFLSYESDSIVIEKFLRLWQITQYAFYYLFPKIYLFSQSSIEYF